MQFKQMFATAVCVLFLLQILRKQAAFSFAVLCIIMLNYSEQVIKCLQSALKDLP